MSQVEQINVVCRPEGGRLRAERKWELELGVK